LLSEILLSLQSLIKPPIYNHLQRSLPQQPDLERCLCDRNSSRRGQFATAAITNRQLVAELTQGCGKFSRFAGLFATGVAIGGVVGPVADGFLLQRARFKPTFLVFADSR
jgi:hypothetical protein